MNSLLDSLRTIVDTPHVLTDEDLTAYEQDSRRRARGKAAAIVRPSSTGPGEERSSSSSSLRRSSTTLGSRQQRSYATVSGRAGCLRPLCAEPRPFPAGTCPGCRPPYPGPGTDGLAGSCGQPCRRDPPCGMFVHATVRYRSATSGRCSWMDACDAPHCVSRYDWSALRHGQCALTRNSCYTELVLLFTELPCGLLHEKRHDHTRRKNLRLGPRSCGAGRQERLALHR